MGLTWFFRFRRPAHVGLAVLGVTAVMVAACADASKAVEVRPPLLVTCYQPLTVTTDGAAGPRFSWTPACGSTYLEVTSPDHQEVFWIVQGDTGKMSPGVTYGRPPRGYESRFGPHELEVGRTYAVRVGVVVEENSFAVLGEGLFVR